MLQELSTAAEALGAAESVVIHHSDSDPSPAMPLLPSDSMSAAPVVRLPIMPLIRLMAAFAASLVITWATYFRGGLSLISDNKDLIFNSLPICPASFVVAFACGLYNEKGPFSYSNVHPVLMVIGFVLLNGEAILAYRTLSGTKKFKKAVHLTIQFLALCLGLIGIWAAFEFHNDKGIDNWYSLHSWLGLACILLFGIQWGVGFATFWYPGGSRNGRALLLPWHVFFGLFIYSLAIVSVATGLLEKATFLQSSSILSRYSNEAFLINLLGVLIVTLGGFVVLAVVTPASIKPDAYRGTPDYQSWKPEQALMSALLHSSSNERGSCNQSMINVDQQVLDTPRRN